MHTAGWVTQNQPNTDAQIFIPALDAFIAAGAGIVQAGLGTSGLVGLKIPPSITGVLQLVATGLILRTGILNSSNYATNRSQEAFGTAAAIPGPSSVAGTSGPSGFGPNSVRAPILRANMSTLIGSTAGAIGKGVRIDWLDFIYWVQTLAATSISGTINKVVTPVGNDSTVVNNSLVGNISLNTTLNSSSTKVHRQRITPTAPAFCTDDSDVIVMQFAATTPATSNVVLAGAVLGCSYNFN